MSTATAPAGKTADTVRDLILRSKKAFQLVLPKHIDADRLCRIALSTITTNPKLMQCTEASLLSSLMEAARLGLEPGVVGQCWLIPYRVKGTMTCQLQIGYQGMLALARRSGEISNVQARIVHDADEFSYEFGLVPKLKHVPSSKADAGTVGYAYAIVNLRDGGQQFEVMSRAEIERVRSKAKAKDDGPWVTHWDEMAKKTVLKRCLKLCPVSIEAQHAIANEERLDVGLPQVPDMEVVSVQDGGGQDKLDTLTKELANPVADEASDPSPDAEGSQEPATDRKTLYDLVATFNLKVTPNMAGRIRTRFGLDNFDVDELAKLSDTDLADLARALEEPALKKAE